MSVECVLRWGEDRVELRLFHVGAVSVDGFERTGTVEGEAVGPETDNGTIDFVAAPELEMSIAFVGMVDGIPVC